jgi:hypothetical protein
MTFFGMRAKEEYLAFKRNKDVFIALDKHQTLTTWDVTSGKIKLQIKLQSDFDLTGFSVY